MRLWMTGPQLQPALWTPSLLGSTDRPRPVLRFGLVMARALKDQKGFITGLRHHLYGCTRPRSYTNFPFAERGKEIVQPAPAPFLVYRLKKCGCYRRGKRRLKSEEQIRRCPEAINFRLKYPTFRCYSSQIGGGEWAVDTDIERSDLFMSSWSALA
jgi:hypothetical protein